MAGLAGGGGCVKETEKMSSSYQNEAELELGLGLSLRSGGGGGGGGVVVKAKKSPPWGEHEYVKIMTAKDFPSSAAGTKRGADCVGPHEVGYSVSPVIRYSLCPTKIVPLVKKI